MPKMYFCTECNKRHKSGKIYEAHMKYKFVEKVEFSSTDLQKIDFPLREIARRQIDHHADQITYNPSRRGLYIQKINELIEYERERERKRQFGLS